MENNIIEGFDPTSYDIDLFSVDIYRNLDSIFQNKYKAFQPPKLFVIATCGIDFNISLIDWRKNIELMKVISSPNIKFKVENSARLDAIIKERYEGDTTEFDQRNSYLKTFNNLASKGFYAYDRKIGEDLNEPFELICYPKFDYESYYNLLAEINKIYKIKSLEKVFHSLRNLPPAENQRSINKLIGWGKMSLFKK